MFYMFKKPIFKIFNSAQNLNEIKTVTNWFQLANPLDLVQKPISWKYVKLSFFFFFFNKTTNNIYLKKKRKDLPGRDLDPFSGCLFIFFLNSCACDETISQYQQKNNSLSLLSLFSFSLFAYRWCEQWRPLWCRQKRR